MPPPRSQDSEKDDLGKSGHVEHALCSEFGIEPTGHCSRLTVLPKTAQVDRHRDKSVLSSSITEALMEISISRIKDEVCLSDVVTHFDGYCMDSALKYVE